MFKNLSSRKKIFSLFILVSAIACLALGIWQIKRHFWKSNLLEEIAIWQDQGGASYNSLKHLQWPADRFKIINYDNFFLADDNFILLGPTYLGREQIFRLKGLITDAQNQQYLVDFGYFDSATKPSKELIKQQISKTQKAQTFLIKPFRKAPFYIPQNYPEDGVWFWPAKSDFENYYDIILADFYLMAINPEIIEDNLLKPNLWDASQIYNEHASYAVIWLSLFFILPICLFFYLRRED